MGRVELMPLQEQAGIVHRIVDEPTPLARDVGGLPAPDHQHLARGLVHPVERIVVHAPPQAALVDVRRVKADVRQDVQIQGRPAGQVAADADAHDAQFAGAARVGLQVVQRGAGGGVITRQLFGRLVHVATVRPCRVVRQDGSCRLQFMVNSW